MGDIKKAGPRANRFMFLDNSGKLNGTNFA
jgi:hypothetical protein